MASYFVTIAEAQAILGVGRMTLYRMENRNELPPKRAISPRRVGWVRSEFMEWVSNLPQAA